MINHRWWRDGRCWILDGATAMDNDGNRVMIDDGRWWIESWLDDGVLILMMYGMMISDDVWSDVVNNGCRWCSNGRQI